MYTTNNQTSRAHWAWYGRHLWDQRRRRHELHLHSRHVHEGHEVGPAPDGLPGGSVEIAANTTAYFFIISASTSSASNFQATISSRLLDAATCAPIAGTTATVKTATAISNNNCR